MSQSSTVATISIIAFAGMSLGSCDAIQYEEAFPVAGEIEQVVVRADRGDVEISVGDAGHAGEIWVDRDVRGWKGALELATRVDDGVLTLDARCRGILTCRVDTRIAVPAGLDVRVELGEGAVALSDELGDVEVEIGEGDLRGEALAAASLWGSVATGDVLLAVDRAEDIAIASADGDVTLDLPGGAWDLALSADDVTVDGLQAEASAARRVEVIAAAGAVSLVGE